MIRLYGVASLLPLSTCRSRNPISSLQDSTRKDLAHRGCYTCSQPPGASSLCPRNCPLPQPLRFHQALRNLQCKQPAAPVRRLCPPGSQSSQDPNPGPDEARPPSIARPRPHSPAPPGAGHVPASLETAFLWRAGAAVLDPS